MDSRSLNFSGLHKRKPVGFGNITARRAEDSNKLNKDRRARRTDVFNLHRNIEQSVCEDFKEPVQVIDRKKELKEYLQKKKAVKEAQLKKKRPPFIVGIPHHGTSPILKEISNTRVQDRAGDSKLKKEFTFSAVAASAKPLTSPHTPTVLKRSCKKTAAFTFRLPIENKNLLLIKPQFLSSELSTETLAVPLSDDGEQSAEQPTVDPQPNNLENKLEDMSVQEKPTVNLQTPRKSQRFSSTKHCSPKPGPSQINSRESAAHRERLEREKCRLLELADKWQNTVQHNVLPQDVIDEVDSVVGQTRLLANDKFKQFSGLIDQFENLFDSQNISNDDLVGFWEMMYLQVEALEKRYSELEVLKSNNWIKSEVTSAKKKFPATRLKKKTTANTTSLFRDIIKTKRAQTTTSNSKIQEKTTVASPVQNKRKSALIAMMISSPGRQSAGKVDTTMNSSQSTATPTRTHNTEVKVGAFDTTLEGNNIQEFQNVTPRRRSERLKKTPSPRRLCGTCDSPDCHNECILGSKHKNQAKSKTPTRFQLKPSNLIVPKEPDVEINTENAKVQKPARMQNSEELSIERKNVEFIKVEEDHNLRRSSRKTRVSKVTFNQKIQEEITIAAPVQKERKSVLTAMVISSPGRQSAGKVDAMMNSSQSTATPTRTHDIDVRVKSFDTTLEENNIQEIKNVTPPRRSERLKMTPTPRRLCAFCDSPDCHSECILGSKHKNQAKSKTPTRFQLKPSNLIVPKEPDDEINTENSKVQKPAARMQNSEELSIERKNVEFFKVEEDHNLRRSSRKTRFSKVTFNQSGGEEFSSKLPSTPYTKTGGKDKSRKLPLTPYMKSGSTKSFEPSDENEEV